MPSPPGHLPVYNDAIQNDPCAKPIVSTVGGTDVSAEALCLPHWAAKHGLSDLKGIITFGP